MKRLVNEVKICISRPCPTTLIKCADRCLKNSFCKVDPDERKLISVELAYLAVAELLSEELISEAATDIWPKTFTCKAHKQSTKPSEFQFDSCINAGSKGTEKVVSKQRNKINFFKPAKMLTEGNHIKVLTNGSIMYDGITYNKECKPAKTEIGCKVPTLHNCMHYTEQTGPSTFQEKKCEVGLIFDKDSESCSESAICYEYMPCVVLRAANDIAHVRPRYHCT